MNKRFRILGGLILPLLVLCLLLAGISVQAQDDQVVASTDRAVSVHLPPGWVFRTLDPSEVYSSVLIFAENSTVLDGAIPAFYVGGGAPPGMYGVVAVMNPTFWSILSPYPEEALFSMLNTITLNPADPLTVNDQFQFTLGGSYDAAVLDATSQTTNQRAYIGGFIADNNIVLFNLSVTPVTAFEDALTLLEGIGDTIHIPAEANAVTAVNAFATPTPGSIEDLPTRAFPTKVPATAVSPSDATAVPTEQDSTSEQTDVTQESAVPAADLVLASSRDGRMSIVLPANWIVYDLVADENVYAYGDTDSAGFLRLASVRPDLVADASGVPTGIGGVVVFYPMSTFGIDPDAVNLEPLMGQLLQNLQASGYEVVEEPAPFRGDGLITVVSGGEFGYIALVPFGEDILYITATGTSDTFEANRDFLLSVVNSVSAPAATPTPAATPLPGLGGLGGLQQPTSQPTIEPTIAPTATPTSAGLGGLGGLQQPTSEATLEVNATEES